MSVSVIGWNEQAAVADVDDCRVRIRRKSDHVLWTCSACGLSIDKPSCAHANALADAPPPPEKKWSTT